MDEIWERAVVMALDGKVDTEATRILTLDGAVKCFQGRLPPPSLLERFQNLQHLSIANIGLTSLEQFPRLQNLQKLILSDNRISGGLEFLVEADLGSLRDLDLSNNRIQCIEDLGPLAHLRLISLDLYECPVTRVKDYRSRVFGLIGSLKYLDKMDVDGNERPESDDEDEEEEEDEEDDPGSGEIDGEDRPYKNGHSVECEVVVDVDEDEESDADEEEAESSRRMNGGHHPQENGFHQVQDVDGGDDDDEDDDEFDEDGESGEEIDADDGGEDVVEVHEISDSDDEDDDAVDDDDEDDDDDDDEVDNEEVDLAGPGSSGRLTSTEGEIDGHEQGEEDGEEDDIGETGEDEQGIEDDGDFDDDEVEEEEDYGGGYLVRPVGQGEGGSGMDPRNVEEDSEEDEVDDVQELPSSSNLKRKRDIDVDEEDDDDDDDDDDGDDDGNGDEDDIVEFTVAPKKGR